MQYTAISLFILLFLFFITHYLTTSISSLTHHITRSRYASVTILSLLLYPGTVVHELSHLLTALILFVPIENLELEPKIEKGYIRAGSVTTHATDTIRQSLISIAPLPVGIFTLWLIQTKVLFIDFSPFSPEHVFSNLPSPIITTLSLFGLFSISASMFPSNTDIRLAGTFPLLIMGIVLTIVCLFSPLNLPFLFTLMLPFLLHILALCFVFLFRYYMV